MHNSRQKMKFITLFTTNVNAIISGAILRGLKIIIITFVGGVREKLYCKDFSAEN